jgi:Contractile injection system tube protein
MTSSLSPRLTKGTIVALNATSKQLKNIVSFQYNPETLSRSLQIQAIESEGAARSEALRLKGAPVETIQLEAQFDAIDRLDRGDPTATLLGIYPQLAALETLIYPDSDLVKENMQLATAGKLEIVPLTAPMTLFIWGVKRILPVRITSFSIAEEAYDTSLNPIRAKVSLSLRVLTYDDFPWDSFGSQLFFAHHVQKELLSKIGLIGGIATTTVSIPASLGVGIGF